MPASCPRYRDFITVGGSEKIQRAVWKHAGADSVHLAPVFKLLPGCPHFFCTVFLSHIIELKHLRSLSERIGFECCLHSALPTWLILESTREMFCVCLRWRARTHLQSLYGHVVWREPVRSPQNESECCYIRGMGRRDGSLELLLEHTHASV